MTQANKDQNSWADSSGGETFPKLWRFAFPDLYAHLIFWPVLALGVLADLFSKKIVFERLSRSGSVGILDGILKFVMAENTGAAFGIAAGRRFMLVATSVIALAGAIVIVLVSGTKQRLVQFALALFAAGVSGNLYDRIFNDGRVRDFIDVMYWPSVHWPAFNLADSMLCISVGLLIISTLRAQPKQATL